MSRVRSSLWRRQNCQKLIRHAAEGEAGTRRSVRLSPSSPAAAAARQTQKRSNSKYAFSVLTFTGFSDFGIHSAKDTNFLVTLGDTTEGMDSMKLLANPLRRSRKRRFDNSTLNQAASVRQTLACKFPDSTDSQRSVIEAVSGFTMTSPERILALCEAVDYVCEVGIDGDIVECGVWRGGSMAAVARTLMKKSVTDRTLWMYDTYDGMSEPSDNDVDFRGQSARQLLDEEDAENAESADSIWCRCSLDRVKETLRETDYPESKLRYIKGKVEETLLQESPSQISILRLDTDWYESTKCELEVLFPKLVPGGVLIIDDFGHWQGCRKAVEEYFSAHRIQMFLNRVDYTGRLGIKLA